MSSMYEDDFDCTSISVVSRTKLHSQRSHNQHSNSNKNNDDETSSPDGLTSKQLKTKLIEAVRNKGILNSIKSQLRNKLVLELNSNVKQNINRSSLALTTINCLIADHLRTNEYDYTLSVFLPECGMSPNDVYGLEDILHVLKVSRDSCLYRQVGEEAVKQKGLLWHLVSYLCSRYVTADAGCQTDFDGYHNIAASLDFKMRGLDALYDTRHGQFKERMGVEERIASFERKAEQRIRAEMEARQVEWKANESERLRLEEREKVRQEMAAYRTEVDRGLKERMRLLEEREKATEELSKCRKEAEEKEMFLQRQALLEEVKALREREKAFKDSTEVTYKIGQVENGRWQKEAETLRIREEKCRQKEEDIQRRMQGERERMKMDLDRAFGHREFLLQAMENQNKQAAQQNELERSQLDRIKREHQTSALSISELQLQVQKLEGESLCLKQENALMRDRLERCMDYDFVKQENKMLLYKLEVSKEMIGEKVATARTTARRGQSKQTDLYVPQRRRSVTFASEAGGVPKLLIEDASEIGVDQDLGLTERDINFPTQREEGERLLEEEVNVRAAEERAILNEADLEIRQIQEMQIFEQRRLAETVEQVKRQVEFLWDGVAVGETKNTPCEAQDTSLGFLDAAKERLRCLESEANCVESKYRDYEHRIRSKSYPKMIDAKEQDRKRQTEKVEIDVEKFVEATLRASAHAKIVREEMEREIEKIVEVKTSKEKNVTRSVEQVRRVDDLIREVKMIKAPGKIIEGVQEARKQLLLDEAKLIGMKNNFRAVIEGAEESSETSTSSVKKNPIRLVKDEDEDRTLNSSRIETETGGGSKKVGFGLDDYVGMFSKDNVNREVEQKKKDLDRSTPPRQTRVKIEYSPSSSSSEEDSHIGVSSDRKVASYPKDDKINNESDNDDDFKW